MIMMEGTNDHEWRAPTIMSGGWSFASPIVQLDAQLRERERENKTSRTRNLPPRLT